MRPTRVGLADFPTTKTTKRNLTCRTVSRWRTGRGITADKDLTPHEGEKRPRKYLRNLSEIYTNRIFIEKVIKKYNFVGVMEQMEGDDRDLPAWVGRLDAHVRGTFRGKNEDDRMLTSATAPSLRQRETTGTPTPTPSSTTTVTALLTDQLRRRFGLVLDRGRAEPDVGQEVKVVEESTQGSTPAGTCGTTSCSAGTSSAQEVEEHVSLERLVLWLFGFQGGIHHQGLAFLDQETQEGLPAAEQETHTTQESSREWSITLDEEDDPNKKQKKRSEREVIEAAFLTLAPIVLKLIAAEGVRLSWQTQQISVHLWSAIVRALEAKREHDVVPLLIRAVHLLLPSGAILMHSLHMLECVA